MSRHRRQRLPGPPGARCARLAIRGPGRWPSHPGSGLEARQAVLDQLAGTRKEVNALRREVSTQDFNQLIEEVPAINGIPVLIAELHGADAETLREMTDRFRDRYPSSVILLASIANDRPILVAAVTTEQTMLSKYP